MYGETDSTDNTGENLHFHRSDRELLLSSALGRIALSPPCVVVILEEKISNRATVVAAAAAAAAVMRPPSVFGGGSRRSFAFCLFKRERRWRRAVPLRWPPGLRWRPLSLSSFLFWSLPARPLRLNMTLLSPSA